jgi:hypothetical protein
MPENINFKTNLLCFEVNCVMQAKDEGLSRCLLLPVGVSIAKDLELSMTDKCEQCSMLNTDQRDLVFCLGKLPWGRVEPRNSPFSLPLMH